MSAPSRGPSKGHTYGLLEGAGAITVGIGLAGSKGHGAGVVAVDVIRGRQPVAAFVYNLKESIPLYGKDPILAEQRRQIAGGAIAAVGGPILRKVPVVGRFFRKSWKVDKKTRLRLA